MDNENENKNEGTLDDSGSLLHWIAVGVVGAALLWIVDWIFGDIIAMLLISAGIVASMVGFGLSATSVYKMVSKLGNKSGNSIMQWWYDTTVPAQSPNRMHNPTREELYEFLKWQMEKEQPAAEREHA